MWIAIIYNENVQDNYCIQINIIQKLPVLSFRLPGITWNYSHFDKFPGNNIMNLLY